MIHGAEQIAALMLGEMGVKEAALGAETVYTRSGGYVYIALETSLTEKEN